MKPIVRCVPINSPIQPTMDSEIIDCDNCGVPIYRCKSTLSVLQQNGLKFEDAEFFCMKCCDMKMRAAGGKFKIADATDDQINELSKHLNMTKEETRQEVDGIVAWMRGRQ